MTAIAYSVDFKGAQLAAAFLGVSPLLAEQISAAMADLKSTLAEDTVMRMDWENPTGALEDSVIEDSTASTWSARIGSHLPYTRRRDWGFQGYDRLGRLYDDLGAFFLDETLEANMTTIEDRIKEAILRTFFGLAASLL